MRRRNRKICLTGGLALLASFAFASVAQATTFQGTNGRIAGSGVLATRPPAPQDELSSELELFTMNSAFNADASSSVTVDPDQCRLTYNQNSDFNPRYSKDGTKIVYVEDNNLWTMQLDAQGKCALDTDNPPNGPDAGDGDPKLLTVGNDSFVGGWCTRETPDTSDPAGTTEDWVVFQRSTASFDVWKQKVKPNRDPDGPPIPLTVNPASDSQPSVTPDCTKIAFHSNRAVSLPPPAGPSPAPPAGSSLSNIWVMGFDGDNPTTPATVLTAGRTRVNSTTTPKQASEESAPSWSPDKSYIVFQTDSQTPSSGPRNLEIYRMDANGSNEQRLTDSGSNAGTSSTGGAETGFDVTGFDLNPSYSPDGSRICFHSGRALDGRDPAWRNSGASGVLGQWEIYTQSSTVLNDSVERKTKRKGNDERCAWQETP